MITEEMIREAILENGGVKLINQDHDGGLEMLRNDYAIDIEVGGRTYEIDRVVALGEMTQAYNEFNEVFDDFCRDHGLDPEDYPEGSGSDNFNLIAEFEKYEQEYLDLIESSEETLRHVVHREYEPFSL